MPRWQPLREPFRATLLRTCAIAVSGGAVLAYAWGGLARWPLAVPLVLWPALGGHFVELWFLNWLRARISSTPAVQIAARFTTWFVGGVILGLGVGLTAWTLGGLRPVHGSAWWLAGFVFIGIELVAHLVLQLSGRANFYDGRG